MREINSQIFIPNMPNSTFLKMSVLLILITLCNTLTPFIRRQFSNDDVNSLTRGMFTLLIFFSVTWTWGAMTYIKMPDLELRDTYALFQVRLCKK